MKVECINIGSIRGSTPRLLIKGHIYTVTGKTHKDGYPCYTLAETDHLPFAPYFYAERFRPLTDISSLTELTKVRELESAA